MKRIATVVAAFALAAPGTAAAASSSTCQAYNPQLCATSASTGTGSPTSSGTLPFTGVNVALLAVGGGGLLGAGLCVRRLSSHSE